ncbi:hypothetical protein TNCV_2381131 [Trichonephila clavipes]|nr:hypothetical protein TNCV_2381131 [Trichonephila clavipes]
MCQVNNYKNVLPAGRLIPIVSNYPNEIVRLDVLGPCPASRGILRKNGSGERRELEGKGSNLKKGQGERHTSIASNRRPLVRSSPGSCIEPNRRTKKCRKETLVYKRGGSNLYLEDHRGRDEIVMPSTSGYNLRPRREAKVESRTANEKRKKQGGPVRSRRSREKLQDSPYTKEQRKSSSRNTRSRRSQQQYCQERKGGANSHRSHSLEVLDGDVNYKT